MSTEAIEIADKAAELLQADYGVKWKTYRRTPMLSVNPKDLPTLGIFILRERRTSDGQPSIGVPQFIHDLTLGFSGARAITTDNEGDLLTSMENDMTDIDRILLRDPTFLVLVEGVVSMDRTSQYSKVGEISLAEIRVEMVVRFRSYLEPVVPDDLETIHVESRYPSADTDPAEVQQIIRQIDLPQN